MALFRVISFFTGLLLFTGNTLANSPRYNTGKMIPEPTKKEVESSAYSVPLPKKMTIPNEWVKYLNPAYEDFWTEGNHKPDAGFMLFARNPSPENARLWLIRMETKAKLLETMWSTVDREYKELIKQGVIKDRYGVIKSQLQANIGNKVKGDLGGTQVYFIFASTCPHCERQASVLKKISKFVMPLQVDGKRLKHFSGLRKSEWADDQTKNDYVKGAVPVLVISNRSKGKVVELKGVQNLPTILKGVANVSKS